MSALENVTQTKDDILEDSFAEYMYTGKSEQLETRELRFFLKKEQNWKASAI